MNNAGPEPQSTCRAFEYGCLEPIVGLDKMLDQLKKRNDLWNALVTIERDFRAKSSELITPEDTTFKALNDEIEKLRKEIKNRRQAGRKKVDVSDLSAKIKELTAQRKEAYAAYKEKKKELIAARRESLRTLEKERREKVKEAYQNSGLYWGNYNDVINNSYNVARISAMKTGTELKYRRFDGTGKISVQLQGELTVENLFKSGTVLQIDPVDDYAWSCPIRAERKRLCQTKVRIRCGSINRAPDWVELPLVLHRPLPVDGVIKSASVMREKIGAKYRYKLLLTVAYPQHVANVTNQGSVGIDFGWRSVAGGLRVAYWVDEQDAHGELLMPTDILDRFNKLDELKSIRANHFNDATAVLKAWIADKSLPDWLKERTTHIALWRSSGKIAALMGEWRKNRFPGDQEIVAYMEEYLKREKHLWLWEVNLRDKVYRRRRELYRIFAAELAGKYSTVFIEKLDLRKLAEKPNPEAGTQGVTPAKRNRTIAAVSILRGIIDSTFAREGKCMVAVEAKDSTTQCHACGHTEKFESEKQIFYTCPACGELWDQDYNAAVNILRRGANTGGPTVPASFAH